MPTKAELEAEMADLKARLAAVPAGNYMQRVNPNLIIALHYASKALWLALAAIFGIIGYQLYALGVKAVGNADANLPFGISFSLHDAGPGLIVMVIALLCSLVGAVKAKVELTPEAIRFMGRQDRGPSENGEATPLDGRLQVLEEAMLEDPFRWAAKKLAKVGKAAVPILIRVLELPRGAADPDGLRQLQKKTAQRRYSAATALGEIGKEAQDAVPSLIATLSDDGDDVEALGAAATALGQIGLNSGEVADALAKASRHTHTYVSDSARSALKRLS